MLIYNQGTLRLEEVAHGLCKVWHFVCGQNRDLFEVRVGLSAVRQLCGALEELQVPRLRNDVRQLENYINSGLARGRRRKMTFPPSLVTIALQALI